MIDHDPTCDFNSDEEIEHARLKNKQRLEYRKIYKQQRQQQSNNIGVFLTTDSNKSDQEEEVKNKDGNRQKTVTSTKKPLLEHQYLNTLDNDLFLTTMNDNNIYYKTSDEAEESQTAQHEKEEEYDIDLDFFITDSFDSHDSSGTEDDQKDQQDNNINHSELDKNNKPLHYYTNQTTNNVCVQLLQLIRDSHVSKQKSQHFMSFINKILPQPNEMPPTIEKLLLKLNIINYFYKRTVCILCKKQLMDTQNKCTSCPTAEPHHLAHIYDTDFHALLSLILRRLSKQIKAYKQEISKPNQNHQKNYDIPFGSIYQDLLQQRKHQNLLSFIIHIDGVGLVKSTKLKMWLCSASIVELPPKIRTRRHNMPLLSIYIGHTDPDPELWLSQCFTMLKQRKEEAFQVHLHNQSTLTFNIIIYGVIGDCPALKIILNMVAHIGYFCCFYCKLRGIHNKDAHKRQYPYQEPTVQRTTQSFAADSKLAKETRRNIYGHLGTTILENIIDIPLPDSILCDYAHVTLLRHFRDVVKIISESLSPTIRKTIDRNLRAQHFPHFFNRKMRGVENFSHIKASELKHLLLYGFIPHFFGFLTTDQSAFISLLICGIRLLHFGKVYGPDTSQIAHNLLLIYYSQHSIYFKHQINFVLHLHAHYSQIYDRHGSLSSINTFAQKDLVGYVSKNRNGSRYFGDLITHYYNIDVFLKSSVEDQSIKHDGPFDQLLSYANDLMYNEIFRYHEQHCKCNDFSECVRVYKRCIINEHVFHSLSYKQRKTTNSYFVQYYQRGSRAFLFGEILIFITIHNQPFALVKIFEISYLFSDYFINCKYYKSIRTPLDDFYFVVKPKSVNIFVPIEQIIQHCIVFENILDKQTVIVTPLSSYTEHD